MKEFFIFSRARLIARLQMSTIYRTPFTNRHRHRLSPLNDVYYYNYCNKMCFVLCVFILEIFYVTGDENALFSTQQQRRRQRNSNITNNNSSNINICAQIDSFVDDLQYERTQDQYEFSFYRAVLLATENINTCELKLNGQSKRFRTLFAFSDFGFQKYQQKYALSASEIFEDEWLLCEIAKRHRLEERVESFDLTDQKVMYEVEGEHFKTLHAKVVQLPKRFGEAQRKREIYIENAKVIASYATCDSNSTIVYALDDMLIDISRHGTDALAKYRMPSLYDFLEKSAFAKDVSITLEAFYVAFNYVKIFYNAGSSRTIIIPTNDAWSEVFSETSLTKSMLFKDESNLDQLKQIVLRLLVSSYSQLQANSFAMQSYASTYGGIDSFFIVPDIYTSDALIHIVGRIPLVATPVEQTRTSSFFDPFFLLRKNARLSLYRGMLEAEGNEPIVDFLQQPLSTVTVSTGVTRNVVGVVAPTNTAFRDVLRFLNIEERLLFPSSSNMTSDDERSLLTLVMQQIITYNTLRILETDAKMLENDDDVDIDLNLVDSYLSYPLLRKPGNVFVGNPISKKVGIRKRKGETLEIRGLLNSVNVLQTLSTSSGVIFVTDGLLIPPTAELSMSLFDRIQRVPFSFVYRSILEYLGLSFEFRGQGFNDVIVLVPQDDFQMIRTLSVFNITAPINTTAADNGNTSTTLLSSSTNFIFGNGNFVDEALYDIILNNVWFNHLQKQSNLFTETYIPLDAHNQDANICFKSFYETNNTRLECNRFSREDLFDSDSESIERTALVEVLEPTNNSNNNNNTSNDATMTIPTRRKLIGNGGETTLNGEIYIIESLLIPTLYQQCSRLPDFQYNQEDDVVQRNFTIPNIYENTKKRFSIEAVVKYKRSVPSVPSNETSASNRLYSNNSSTNTTSTEEVTNIFACDAWCLGPTSWIFCIPCEGKQFQVIFSTGGFAPYQEGGGAMILAVSDNNELFFGVTPYVETFNLQRSADGGGLRLLDARVKAIGFAFAEDRVEKILATYDGYSNVTKIYVDGKFLGAGSLDGFQYEPFDDKREEISIGTLGILEGEEEKVEEPILFRLFPRLKTTYDNDVRSQYLDWGGEIESLKCWFDFVKYPSTCID